MNRDAQRIVDANLNRASEGLRVVEDIFRYALNDAPVQQRLKDMRHRLAFEFEHRPLIAARDAVGDVGFASKGMLEERRSSLEDIVRSNMKRVQEALRVLEEIMKLESPEKAGRMKAMRYECYGIERDMEHAFRKPLRKGLYLILTNPATGYERLTEIAVSEGIPAVQLRYKGDDSRAMLRIARAMRAITAGTGTLFIVNDRVDIALMAEADGVHLGQQDLPPKEARRLLGNRMLVGLSTHAIHEVEQARDEPVDYIGFGPVFAPFSKENHAPVTGIHTLKEAVSRSRLPVVAIGGITRQRLEEFAGVSCGNAACIGAVATAADPALEMRIMNAMIGEFV